MTPKEFLGDWYYDDDVNTWLCGSENNGCGVQATHGGFSACVVLDGELEHLGVYHTREDAMDEARHYFYGYARI